MDSSFSGNHQELLASLPSLIAVLYRLIVEKAQVAIREYRHRWTESWKSTVMGVILLLTIALFKGVSDAGTIRESLRNSVRLLTHHQKDEQ